MHVVTMFHAYHWEDPDDGGDDEVYDGIVYAKCSCGIDRMTERKGRKHAKRYDGIIEDDHATENDI